MNKRKVLMDKQSQDILEKGEITKETKLLLQYGETVSSDIIKVIATIEPKGSNKPSCIDIYRWNGEVGELDFICTRTDNYYKIC